MSLLGVTPSRSQPCGPRSPHFIRLLPASMTRMRLISACSHLGAARWRASSPPLALRGTPSPRGTCSRLGAARRRSRAPQRDLARQEARAARTVGQHQRAARIHAGDLAGHGGAVGQQQPYRLALVGMAVLPFGGERRETLARVELEAPLRAPRAAPRAADYGRWAAPCARRWRRGR